MLPRQTVTSILGYAESHVLWQHCCLHPPTFNDEVNVFWRALSGHEADSEGVSPGWSSVEPTWVALLYVVMGIAVHQMDDIQASKCGLSDGEYADGLRRAAKELSSSSSGPSGPAQRFCDGGRGRSLCWIVHDTTLHVDRSGYCDTIPMRS
jgi:hypothetical protein